MRRIATIFIVWLVLASGSTAAQTDTLLEQLRPQGLVNDFAGVIESQADPIEALLRELEQKTGAQVAVVTLDTLDGGDLRFF